MSQGISGSSQARHITPLHQEASKSSDTIQLIVKTSNRAAYQTESTFDDKTVQQALEEAITGESYDEALLPDTSLQFTKKGQVILLGVTPEGKVIDVASRQMLKLPSKAQEALQAQVQALRAKHYGELLTWEEASLVLPKYSSFTVLDVETGLSFEGQRRAGSHHADVQPLTKTDSATLKTIYGGDWSWDRKCGPREAEWPHAGRLHAWHAAWR